jgi:hypothetical protein
VKFLLVLLVAGLASAQSNPSWWKYAPPTSTSIVGIQWKTMRSTLFAPAIAAEMAPGGSLGFPNLDVLRNADQVLIGGPEMLAVEYGTFPVAKLRAQATEQGMRRTTYKSVEIWVSPEADVHSVAYLNDKLVLVGTVDAIQESIARVADPKGRSYSPLMARAARYSKEDLWVVCSSLPDPLASLFVPFEIEATGFEGSVSAWNGLHAVASIERPNATKALDFADSLAETLASRPALAEGTEITTKERAVLIRVDLNEEQLASSLRRSPTAAVTVAVAAPVPAPVHPQAILPPAKPAPLPTPTVVSETIPEVELHAAELAMLLQPQLPPAPPKPKTVKILGLDSGTREIPLGK